MNGLRGAAAARYRPEIDGLRAVAVVAVLLYHAALGPFGGGFAGVDVFFVISGYLISGIVIRELDTGIFSLAAFFERRARRILPALLCVLIACATVAWFVLLPDALRSFSTDLLAALGFATNLHLLRAEVGYFAAPVDTMPLLHLWSLAVEEQFYLLFPVIMIAAWRLRLQRLMLVVALAFVGLLALCGVIGAWYPAASFYMLPTRMWEFLAGTAVALAEHRRMIPQISRRGAMAVVTIGAVAIAVPIITLDSNAAFPFPWALAVVGGTGAIIAFIRSDDMLYAVLSSPVFVIVGKISYSLYLWHYPILFFFRAVVPDALSVEWRIGALILSVALAAVTWKFVEQPFRKTSTVGRKQMLMWVAAIVPLLFITGAVGRVLDGAPGRLTRHEQILAATGPSHLKAIERCSLPEIAEAEPYLPCHSGRSGPVRTALIGDSHAAALASAVGDAVDAIGERAVQYVFAGCPPVLRNDALKNELDCARFNRKILALVASNNEIDTVVVAARWHYRLAGTPFDNGEGGIETGLPYTPTTARERAAIVASFGEMIDALLAANKRVVIVYPVPEAGWDVPRYLIKKGRWAPDAALAPTTSHAAFRARSKSAYAALDAVGIRDGLIRLYPERHLCNTDFNGRCALVKRGVPLYFDDDHLSKSGAKLAVPEIGSIISDDKRAPGAANIRPGAGLRAN